jgi:hypothetical protein
MKDEGEGNGEVRTLKELNKFSVSLYQRMIDEISARFN